MELYMEEISSIQVGWINIRVVLCNSSVGKNVSRFDNVYKEIKNNPDFIRINYHTWINYYQIDMINHKWVYMCGGKVFRLGHMYRKHSIDQYMSLTEKKMK